MKVQVWDEISCEWSELQLDLSPEASAEEICREVDRVVAEPVGLLPPEEAWNVTTCSRAKDHLLIECRTERGFGGLILVPSE